MGSRFKFFIDELTLKLGKPLPGREAQMRMAPLERKLLKDFIPPGITPRVGAVMVLLFPKDDIPHFVLIERATYPGVHSGQISFPGGQVDKNDPNMEYTAIRETKEEIGINETSLEVLGGLSDLYIPPSNFHVHPFVGFIPETPAFIPDPREVHEIFTPSVDELVLPGLEKTKTIFNKRLNKEIEAPCFEIQGKTVWGATAMIISELRELLKN